MSEDAKHFPDCWRVHPVCAQLRIRELEREVAHLRQGIYGVDMGHTATGPVPCFPEPLKIQGVVTKVTPREPHPDDAKFFEALQRGTLPDKYIPDPMLLAKGPSDFPVGPLVTHDLSEELFTTPQGLTRAITDCGPPPLVTTTPLPMRIPGSASWTAPAVDDPPTVLDAHHPHP